MTENLFQNNFRRLNDIDENILNNNSFKDLDDKTLKLECIIAEKEEGKDIEFGDTHKQEPINDFSREKSILGI